MRGGGSGEGSERDLTVAASRSYKTPFGSDCQLPSVSQNDSEVGKLFLSSRD